MKHKMNGHRSKAGRMLLGGLLFCLMSLSTAAMADLPLSSVFTNKPYMAVQDV